MATITPAFHRSPSMFDRMSEVQQLGLLRILLNARPTIERVRAFGMLDTNAALDMSNDLSDLARDLMLTLAHRLEFVDTSVEVLVRMPTRGYWTGETDAM